MALAHFRGVPVFVDGAQSAPHIPVDVREIGCDFDCFNGHKVYGPSGVGVLYGTAEWLDKLPPSLGGEPMAEEVTFEGWKPKPPPEKFAAGVPALASTVALSTALDYLNGLDRERVANHVGGRGGARSDRRNLARARANGDWRSLAERVNKHCYRGNWLHNLLVSASLAGFSR